MEVRRVTALRYYHEKVAPFRPLKEAKSVKKVMEKEKEPVRTLFIENKKVLLFFE